VRAKVVRIGNSRGIRIPKPVLRECRLEGEVEIQIHKDGLLIRPAVAPREGWAEAFERMAKAGDDRLLDEGRWGETTWERRDWRW